jgi:hypothetical protein
MKKVVGILVALVALGGLVTRPTEAQQKDKINEVMQEKLKNAKLLLEGLALADYKKLARSAEELLILSKRDEWFVYKTPRYEVQTNEFRRACEAVLQKAKDKNLDGAALAYFEMTLSCIKCHQYVRDVRDTRGPAPTLQDVFAAGTPPRHHP